LSLAGAAPSASALTGGYLVPAEAIPEVAAFGWVAGTVIGDAACLTLVRSADPYLVARGFGGDPAGARPVTLAEAAEAFPDSSWLAVRVVGLWVLAVEVNGWQGTRPEVLERLSAGTRAVSVYWNVNGQTRFSLAAAGHVLTTFDPQFPDRRDGADPDGLEAVRAGLPWDDALPRPLALALAARVTGHPARPAWLGGTFEVIPVEALPEGLRAATDPDTEPLTYDDPPLAWALRRSAGEQQRAAALAAARYAVRVAGLEDHPDVRLALAGDGRAAAEGLAKLSAVLDRAARKSAGDPRPAGRFWAVTALREAANPVPVMAGFAAVSAAMTAAAAFGEPPDGPRDAVLPVLGDPVPPSGSLGLASAPGPLPTDRYLWTAAHWLAPVGCITFLRDRSPAETVRAFGGDDAAAVPGVPGLFRDRIAAVREDRGWAVVVEHHELMGLFSRHEQVRPGTAVSISWSARGRSWLHYVVDGRFVAMLDPQRPEQRDGDDPAVLDEHLAGLRLGAVPGNAAACLPTLLVLAQRLTGLAWSPEVLDEPHLLSYLPARPR
jgi:Family of unknown function (DUF6461)